MKALAHHLRKGRAIKLGRSDLTDQAVEVKVQDKADLDAPFDVANFRIMKLAAQRNEALDQVILLQEQLEQSRLENRRLHVRVAELVNKVNPIIIDQEASGVEDGPSESPKVE